MTLEDLKTFKKEENSYLYQLLQKKTYERQLFKAHPKLLIRSICGFVAFL
jgi:hypothetical protein